MTVTGEESVGLDDHHQDSTKGTIRFKHALLRQYLPKFVGKAGKRATGHEVHYFDGFAGAGLFEDGTPAGAAHTLRMIAGVAKADRTLVCTYVEKKHAHYVALKALVEANPSLYPGVTVKHGRAEKHIADAAAAALSQPFFVFLDPYGLNVPFDVLRKSVLSRPPVTGRATELLMLYSHGGVRRAAARLTETPSSDDRIERGRQSTMDTLDAFMGTTGWRTIWQAGRGDVDQQLLSLYQQQIHEYGNFATIALPMRDRAGGSVEYILLFATRHPEGIWTFVDEVGHAHEKWCAELGVPDAPPQPSLFDDAATFDSPWRPTNDDLTATVADNLREELERGGSVTPIEDVSTVYGEVLGVARATHVRAALKELAEEGIIDDDAKGTYFYQRKYKAT